MPDLNAIMRAAAQAQAEDDAKTAAPSPLVDKPRNSSETTGKQWMRAAMYAIPALLDVHSTQQALGAGAREMNPMYGDHPSTGKLLLGKAAVGLPLLYLLHKIAEKGYDTEAGIGAGLMGAAQTMAAVNNYDVASRKKQ